MGGKWTLPRCRRCCISIQEVERELQLFVAALAQVVTASLASEPAGKIDATVPRPCKTQEAVSNEIVVCARRGDGLGPHRIKQMPPDAGLAVPKAEVTLPHGVVASADTERADVGGFPSNRFMVGIKIKF
jgi:hypothetical protein